MWFDPVALSKPQSSPPANLATSAIIDEKPQESQKSQAPTILEIVVAAPWDSFDWQAYYDERAGVAEFDGGLSRHDAEAQAFLCCIAEWLCQHPATSEPGSCAQCGRGDLAGRDLLPYGDAIHGHKWLHGECWGTWYAHRRRDAIAALKALGFQEGGQRA